MLKEAADLIMETSPILAYIFVFLFGVCIGSFLNVCIYRIPEKQSIVTVPSHCMTCGKKLHWYELIPLFSWLALRGKCLGCKSKISWQYPLVEFTNGILWVIVLFAKGLNLEMLFCQALISTLFVIAVIDARTMEIPFSLNIFIGVVGVIKAIFFHENLLDLILGPVVIGLIFFGIFFFSGGNAMGGGDVKLVIAAGIFLGLKCSVAALVIACVSASVIHLSLMAIKKAGRRLAFGPYLALGYVISALFGEKIVGWYLQFFNM